MQGFEQFTAPQANWGGVLVKIRDSNPDVIVFSDYAAGDEAAFIKQFAQNPTKSLVYQQYAPSIPQYLQLAGSSANGVIWSTTVGILQNDPVAQPFIDKLHPEVRLRPGLLERRRPVRPREDLGAGRRRGRRPVRLPEGHQLRQGHARTAASAARTRSTAPA